MSVLQSLGRPSGWTAATPAAVPAIAAGLVILLATIFRNPLLFTDPQMVSEDVFVYFNEDRLFGAAAILERYSGYMQLSCRLIAFVVGFFPAKYAAMLYAAAFVSVIFATAAIIYTSPIFTGWGKPLAAVALVCSPTNSEVFFGMLYSQWIMAPLVGLALYESPASRSRGAVMLGSFAMVGLSSPFGILALPFAAWKAATERTRYSFLLVGAAVLVTLAQLDGIIARSASNTTPGTSFERALQAGSIFYSWLTGPRYPGLTFALAISIPTAAFAAWYLWRNRETSYRAAVYFVAFGMATLIPGCMWVDASLHANQFLFGGRYFYPAVVWIVLAFIVIEQNSERHQFTLPAIAIALAAMCVAHVRPIHGHITNRVWRETAECVDARQNCVMLMNPGKTGFVRVPSSSEIQAMQPGDHLKFMATQRWM